MAGHCGLSFESCWALKEQVRGQMLQGLRDRALRHRCPPWVKIPLTSELSERLVPLTRTIEDLIELRFAVQIV
jgi:hypothetical protein